MKKKILFALLMVAIFVIAFAVSVSAETPAMYIEFGAKFPESNEYITVYTQNAESSGNPQINFTSYKFYSDVEFTNEVDMSTAIGIDFSVAKTHGSSSSSVTRMTKPTSPFTNCVEVKWFLSGMPTVSYNGSFFNGWSSLKSFDFGNATAIADNTFQGCGFETITLPATITSIGGSAFRECQNLKSVKIEGVVTKFGNGSTFYNCTALETVELADGITFLHDSMFSKCTSLKNITIPSTVTEIKGYVFNECKALTSISIPNGVTKIGNGAFTKSGLTSLHIPASVQSLGYQVAEESAITSLTFAENSSLTFIDHRAFMNCDSLVGTVILPDGLIEIDYGLFSGSEKLQAVKMPDSVTTLSGDSNLFNGCKSLEYVQFSKNITSICKSMFEGCTSLKAISFPDNITSISYKALRGCTSLQAVYLPANLTSLGKSSGNSASDWGVFYQSPNVYLVNEPFEVFDGDTLLGDKFVMPEKPDVYYMPKNMTVLGNSEFQGCNNLNSVIVFPVGVTSAADCSQGAFYCENRSNPVTVVFLGDMNGLIIRQNNNSYRNLSFVFAHPNDKSISDVGLVIGAANNGYQTNSYAYFCAGNVVYDLSTFKAANSTKYTVLEADFAKTTEKLPHIAEPNKTVATDPTCEKGRGETMYCFCGAYAGFVEVENTALGHNHNVAVSITYESYMKDGFYSYKCERCEDVSTDTVAPAIFTCSGYSTPENGKCGLAISFAVNKNALADYEAINSESLKYGAFAVAYNNIGENDILSMNNAVKAEIDREYGSFEMKLTGFETEAQMNAKLTIGAYVIDKSGKVTYLQPGAPLEGDKYCYVSYNSIVNQ